VGCPTNISPDSTEFVLSNGYCDGNMAPAPFNGVDVAIAYILVFIPIFLVRFLSLTRVIRRADALKITLFLLGGFLLISKDFEGPDVGSEETSRKNAPPTAQTGCEGHRFPWAPLTPHVSLDILIKPAIPKQVTTFKKRTPSSTTGV